MVNNCSAAEVADSTFEGHTRLMSSNCTQTTDKNIFVLDMVIPFQSNE